MTKPNLQFFTLVSLPITQTYRSLDDRQLFRIGAGAIIIFGGRWEGRSLQQVEVVTPGGLWVATGTPSCQALFVSRESTSARIP